MVLFYIRFVIESANEIDSKEAMTLEREDNDRIQKIRERIKDAERAQEKMESWRKAGESAAMSSQQWSPTLYVWKGITSLYQWILWIHSSVLRIFSIY